jgi:hypothetical protein
MTETIFREIVGGVGLSVAGLAGYFAVAIFTDAADVSVSERLIFGGAEIVIAVMCLAVAGGAILCG